MKIQIVLLLALVILPISAGARDKSFSETELAEKGQKAFQTLLSAIKLLLLISALTLASVTGKAQDYRPAKKDLAWGDDSKGLRMAVWTNPETDQVFSVILNFSTRQISYYDIIVYHEVYARQDAASKWRQIKLKSTEPKEVIALLSCNTIEPKEKEEVRDYLDLREYDFPSGWNGLVEVRIVRVLSSADGECDKSYRTAKVKSRTFNVKLPFPEAAAQR